MMLKNQQKVAAPISKVMRIAHQKIPPFVCFFFEKLPPPYERYSLPSLRNRTCIAIVRKLLKNRNELCIETYNDSNRKAKLFVNKIVNKSLQFKSLGGFRFKGSSTTAIPFRIRIVNAEAGVIQRLHKVNSATLKKGKTLRINDQRDTIVTKQTIIHLRLINLHRVLPTCAPPFFD